MVIDSVLLKEIHERFDMPGQDVKTVRYYFTGPRGQSSQRVDDHITLALAERAQKSTTEVGTQAPLVNEVSTKSAQPETPVTPDAPSEPSNIGGETVENESAETDPQEQTENSEAIEEPTQEERIEILNFIGEQLQTKTREETIQTLLGDDGFENISETEATAFVDEALALLDDSGPHTTALDPKATTEASLEAEHDKEYPRFLLPVPKGVPTWSNEIMYGPAREVVLKMSEFNETHPAALYTNLLTSFGNAIGRTAHFVVGPSRHFTNLFLAVVGKSSTGRKGTARDAINGFMRLIDPKWEAERTQSGFGSGEALIYQIRDASEWKKLVKGKNGQQRYETIVEPGIPDKRLCVRQAELSGLFAMASKPNSLAEAILQNGWDGVKLENIVKGKDSAGANQSARCLEPHLSVTGDITPALLLSGLPDQADFSGFGNRFLYVLTYKTQQCPNGGPIIDWGEGKLLVAFHEALEFAKTRASEPYKFSRTAARLWSNMYTEIEALRERRADTLAHRLTLRAESMIRRIAVILAVIDKSEVIEVKHLRAAKDLWDYCESSAYYVFDGQTLEAISIREKIMNWMRAYASEATAGQVRRGVFKDNESAQFVRAQLLDLVKENNLALKPGKRANSEIFALI